MDMGVFLLGIVVGVFLKYVIVSYYREEDDFILKEKVISRFNSDRFINNVCLSYRHDFGLLADPERESVRRNCKYWMRAILNNWDHHK